jgi:hypothetical protein
MSFDAFISYSSEDKTAANAACAMLEGAGIRCWIAPRDIRAGQEYGAAIIDAIDHCQVMVLVFSSSANTSRQIHREIERAVAKGIPILPVRIEEVTPTDSLEYFLGAIHWLDALTPPLEKHLQQLADTVKTMLKFEPDLRDRPAGDEAHRALLLRGEAERFTRRAKDAQQKAKAVGLPVDKRARSNWLLPAVAAAVLLVVVAGGGWLYHLGVFAPGNVSTPISSQPRQTAPTTLR